ncbi:hypothetical protein Mal64_01620 [Pseudobythopirellula maris]|uniref:Sialidase domain-containing protein n=1 Tax=Pseudobythopirellula maris TaxID=2527991 RepID=A0A5C5ZUD5_9BACT|nr:BNR repeat-containing protein [Pseudobythopirellula maris]TWT89783.1 hypothetical protein Mal64_01620 [Pseudobythopirellula maris]
MIAFGVDGEGYLHLAWGMHNHDLRYIRSASPATLAGPIAFGEEITVTGSAEGLVTYPQFYNTPAGDLLFSYRTGNDSGGGSGNGDTQVNRCDLSARRWEPMHRPLFDGDPAPSEDAEPRTVNSYPNNLAWGLDGELHMTWTCRDTWRWQSNSHLYYARSSDGGATWRTSSGEPLPLPLSEANAERIAVIPEGSSLINQASMTVDREGRPLVATWWAPGAHDSPPNHSREYMLVHHDGERWRTSQITHRNAQDDSRRAEDVRDLARPIVLVDDTGRTLVVMRYDRRGDVVTVAHSTDRKNWELLDLTIEPLGTWEPNHDAELWRREGRLHLLHQRVGLGERSSPIGVLEWDARGYFVGR